MIDFTKRVGTRNGVPVQIITTTGRGQYPILGYVGESTVVDQWTESGKYYVSSSKTNDRDLINLVKYHVVYLDDETGIEITKMGFHSEEEALEACSTTSFKILGIFQYID